MPFTFSHPAIVLPLYKRFQHWFSLTGLIVGSITPDFEYYIRMTKTRLYTHNWGGLFWADLPLGIILAFIFHNVVKQPLVAHLPPVFKRKLLPYTTLRWNTYCSQHFFVVCISLLIGGASHLVWDSITHDNGDIARFLHISGYRYTLGHVRLHITSWLQLLSSVLGMWYIVWVIVQLPNYPTSLAHLPSYTIKYFWWKVLAIMFIIIGIRFYISAINRPVNMLITILAAGMYGLTITALFYPKKA